MLVDNNKSLLVLTALGRYKPGKGVWVEFYQVDGVLALQNLAGATLTGHPGMDLLQLPDGEQYIYLDYIRPGVARRMKKWLEKNRFTVLSIHTRRNRAAAITRTVLGFSWRQPSDYLTEEQCFWLDIYAGASFEYTDRLQAAIAIGQFIQALQGNLKNRPPSKPKRRKTRAKDRRASERRQRAVTG